MSDRSSIQTLEDLLGGGEPVVEAQNPAPAPAPTPAPQQAPAPQPTTAAQQAVPGTSAPVKGPQNVQLPSVVSRNMIVPSQTGTPAQATPIVDLSDPKASFETNLGKLLAKSLELSQHDRAMAIALFQVHLDRAEVLDTMAISMPVAQVIGDNTGATLKALELAMKAGERVHKAAELLVDAQRNGDVAALNALKLQLAKDKGEQGWGDEKDLPGQP